MVRLRQNFRKRLQLLPSLKIRSLTTSNLYNDYLGITIRMWSSIYVFDFCNTLIQKTKLETYVKGIDGEVVNRGERVFTKFSQMYRRAYTPNECHSLDRQATVKFIQSMSSTTTKILQRDRVKEVSSDFCPRFSGSPSSPFPWDKERGQVKTWDGLWNISLVHKRCL